MSISEIATHLPALLSALLIAVLFIQSGLDKVFDWKGNFEWLNGHFSKTFLSRFVPIMLAKLTVLELATGVLSVAGIVYFLAVGSTVLIFWAAALGALTVVGLFFGQRVAKDYPGAAVLVPYFILLIALLYLTNPYVKG
ncbi:MAG: DoxX family protein [Pyrinomonadaceae bacterium]